MTGGSVRASDITGGGQAEMADSPPSTANPSGASGSNGAPNARPTPARTPRAAASPVPPASAVLTPSQISEVDAYVGTL